MNLISRAIKRPTAVVMFTVAVLVTGLVSFTRLPLNLTPDVTFPKLSVITYWPDTSPETVEAFVTSPIEAVANTVTQVKGVDSISEEGQSTVNIEFNRGTDMDFAALELSEKLSLIREDLPYGVQPPQIQKYVPEEFRTGRFLSYHLTGAMSLAEIRRFAIEHVRGPLLTVEGVADVQVLGGRDAELQIEIDPVKIRALGLSEEQVSAALQDLNVRLSAGKIYRAQTKYDLLVLEPLLNPEQIGQTILAGSTGALVRLRDVATVSKGYGEPRTLTRIDGNPAVVLNIEKEIGTNTIRVADRVFATLAQLQQDFPATLKLIKERDQSQRIRDEIGNLSSRAAFSILVIFLVLLLFLRDRFSPLIILATIFFSVLLTINLFYFAGIGLNLLTLAGLALGFGMLVDNSIVVLDNIMRYRQRGEDAFAAATKGTSDVILPIIASTLTSVVAFVPFIYLTGELRLYYLPFAIAVALSLVSSLIVAFTFTPSLSARFLNSEPKARASAAPPSDGQGTILRFYQRVLAFSIRHKLWTILITLAIFAASYHLFDKYVTKGRIWSWGEDTYLMVVINMQPGAEIGRTDAIARSFEERLLQYAEVDKIFTNISSAYARIEVSFPREVQYSVFPLILKEQLTGMAVQIAGPEVGVYGFGPGFFSGGGMAPQFRLQVLGYNYNEVKRIAENVGKTLARNPRVRDVNTSSSLWWRQDDLSEMGLRVDRARLAEFHIGTAELLQTVQSYLRESLRWQRIKLAGKEMDYRIKMRGFRAFDLEKLHNLLIPTPAAETVRLRQVAQLSERKVLAKIIRANQQYQRSISFEYRGPWKFGDRLVESVLKNTTLPHGYKLERASFLFLQEEEKRQIYWVLAFALLLVYMVTASLFESLRQPFIVMLTVPLALIGVFGIFFVTDTNFDRSAYIGVILLAGIVVNNAIILVDHINRLRHEGWLFLDAVIQGAGDRARPILMTSATTILGLLPLVLFTKPDASIWYALALATIGGLLSSTLLVLLVIPVWYVILGKERA